jgi:hypothetical protein
MKGIRCLANGRYVVRVNINGNQQHVGTYSTREKAVVERDKRMCWRSSKTTHDPVTTHNGLVDARQSALAQPADPVTHGAGRLQLPSPRALQVDEVANGVYARRIAAGTVYDVQAYKDGCYCWGGRHRTLAAANRARANLQPTRGQVNARETLRSAASVERGITVRINKGRGASTKAVAVYVARVHDKGGKHLGTFASLDLARKALATYHGNAV